MQRDPTNPSPAEFIRALVCGRSKRERDATLIAMISHALIDETGMGLDTGVFAMGGLIASAETWESLSQAWQDELDQEPKLPPIHMAKLYAQEDEFENVDGQEMYRRLSKLAAIVMAHDVHGFMFGIGSEDWKLCRAQFLCDCKRERFGHPYEWGCQLLAAQLLSLGDHVGRDYGKVDFIFDWQQTLHVETKATIDRELPVFLEKNHPHLRPRLGELHWPRDRSSYRGLQAADILAWQFQRVRLGRSYPRDAIIKQLAAANRASEVLNMDAQFVARWRHIVRFPCSCDTRPPLASPAGSP